MNTWTRGSDRFALGRGDSFQGGYSSTKMVFNLLDGGFKGLLKRTLAGHFLEFEEFIHLCTQHFSMRCSTQNNVQEFCYLGLWRLVFVEHVSDQFVEVIFNDRCSRD
jgi:hypothetical protein